MRKQCRVLVTGAGSGVGQGILKALRASGLPVILVAADIAPMNIALYRADEALLIPRVEAGNELNKIVDLLTENKIDVVIPIPDTSRQSAQALAETLGLKVREGFMKNRYIGRTFIMPGQKERKKSVRQKLSPVKLEFAGKNVLLVDDSIVRGTTSQEIIQMARDAGARKVFIASAAPGVRYPNVYGIDMPSASELIAHDRTDQEVERLIGADWLIYQDLEDLVASASDGNKNINNFECSVFDGNYVTGDISSDYLQRLDAMRNDSAKTQSEFKFEPQKEQVIGIHNEFSK